MKKNLFFILLKINKLISMSKFCYLIIVAFGILNFQGDKRQEVKVEIEFVKNGYDDYKVFARETIQKLQIVLNSDEFRKSIKNGIFLETNNLNNSELFETIINGYEVQCPEKYLDNNVSCNKGEKGLINLKVRTIDNSDHKKWLRRCAKKPRRGSTIGIDGVGDGVTAICPQRLQSWSASSKYGDLGGHFMHEYMHILGFSHNKKKSKSAVYQIGNIVKELIDKNN
ncbi:hypothetical protein [Winogradskyella rapida]|uniref:Metalloendopeptidase n=1 Tax=Winogradskyella rapida TaxID=549701 RepID=A0ABW3KQB3_9FLAO